jgi:hypothetical protein
MIKCGSPRRVVHDLIVGISGIGVRRRTQLLFFAHLLSARAMRVDNPDGI